MHRPDGATRALTPAMEDSGGVENCLRSGDAKPGAENISDFLLWQLADSAFPTGGFAHSAGLEAAWQHGEVRNRMELLGFLETNLHQLGRVALPFVNTAYDEPGRLVELDELCDVFLSNHVTNRASRLQGKAFLAAVEKIFLRGGAQGGGTSQRESALKRTEGSAPYAHFAPIFGVCLQWLEVPRGTTLRLFYFNHLRALLAAAVRLNIVGPMEAQVLQHRLSSVAGKQAELAAGFTLDHLAQMAPLLDFWQGAQDRLYSRLFQS